MRRPRSVLAWLAFHICYLTPEPGLVGFTMLASDGSNGCPYRRVSSRQPTDGRSHLYSGRPATDSKQDLRVGRMPTHDRIPVYTQRVQSRPAAHECRVREAGKSGQQSLPYYFDVFFVGRADVCIWILCRKSIQLVRMESDQQQPRALMTYVQTERVVGPLRL